MTLNVAIIGPGRSKQGTGPYIAKTFKQLGCNVQAVVSSSLESAKIAVANLKTEHEIDCQAYKSLEEVLKHHTIDIVAISSPPGSHLQYLKIAAQAECHIFCEKPLFWSSEQVTHQDTIDLVNTCHTNRTLLQLNTQWPYTLPTYYELYPQIKNQPIQSFSMWLSPQSQGSDMIIDTVSHLLSMLYTLLGAGKINNIESNFHKPEAQKNLQIEFDFLHAFGDTHTSLSLLSSDTLPKPAAYAINNLRADRHVELPNYLISLHSHEHQLPVEDPLVSSIKNFISTIHSKTSSDEVSLIDGMAHLTQIYQAVTKQKPNKQNG